MQNKDSLMALEIVYHFYQKGIPVLPVHDSFIIEKQYTEDLKKEMKAIFQGENFIIHYLHSILKLLIEKYVDSNS